MALHLTNVQIRSLGIFAAYNATCVLAALRCIKIIANENRKATTTSSSSAAAAASTKRRRMRLFSALAALTISITWYHMIAFYFHSYQEWEQSQQQQQQTKNQDVLQQAAMGKMASWLQDTQLFEQAWAAVVETEPRLWWSSQIFSFCAGWSVLLGIQGAKYKIRGLWTFMFLGQIVSIAFAANLSFLAILAAQHASSTNEKPKSLSAASRGGAGVIPHIYLIIAAACAVLVPYAHAQREFMPILLVPHILAFAPLIPGLRPSSRSVYVTAASLGVLLMAHTTTRVLSRGLGVQDLTVTIHEHPAVSSVTWDVICCWISFGAWSLLGQA